MDWIKKGTTTGTGAALIIPVGYTPSCFKIRNPKTGASLTFFSGMNDDTAIKKGGDIVVRQGTLAIGTPKTDVAVGDVVVAIDGMKYLVPADSSAAITTTTCAHSDVHDHYAAFGLSVGADGTVDAGPDAAANATGYHSAALAIAGLLAVAPAAGHVLIGIITVKIDAAGADFVGGTTELDAAGYTVTYIPMSNIALVGGITPYAGALGFGVTLGTDPNVNVLGDTLYWEAYR